MDNPNCCRSWKRRIGRYQLTWTHRCHRAPMGRFGGGWQWEVGIQVGGSGTVMLNLLTSQLRIQKVGR